MNKLPDGWVTCEIGEVTQIVNGGTPSTKDPTNFSIVGGIPWITPSDLSGYKEIFISRGARNLSKKGLAESSASILPKGSVLFSSRAPIGYVAIAKNELATNQGFKSFILPDGLNSKFVYFYLRHIIPLAESIATGTTFKELSKSKIAQLPLLIAPLAEQQRIADKLDILLVQVDACLVRLERVLGILQQFRLAVLVAATSGDLTADWREERGLSRESWEKQVGTKIFPFITSGSRGWAKYYADSGAMFLRVGDLAHGTIALDLSNVQHVNLPETVEGQRSKVEPGDILISITADIGRVALIEDHIGEAYISQHLCLARQNGEYLSAYLAYYLASPEGGFAQLSEMQKGMVKAGLKLGNIRDLEFEIPERQEQDEIVRRIQELFALADRIEKRCHTVKTQVEQLTPILLDKAFRGELVPQDPNDEPATVLLEHIQAQREREAVEPKPTAQIERPRRIKMTVDTVKEAINQLPEDIFSFDELREKIPGDYETLKSILFELLTTPEPSVTQFFDQSSSAMRFIRSKK